MWLKKKKNLDLKCILYKHILPITVIFVKSNTKRKTQIRCKQETVNETESPLKKKKSSRKLRYIIFIIPLLLFFLFIFLISTMRRN